MSVFIPCLNPDSGNNLSGSGIQLVTPQSIAAGVVNLAGTAVPVTIGETALYLNPYTALLAFAINWQFWADLFGLGETRIDREKAEIQVVFTAIFQYLHTAYSVPLRDGHALLFPSDGVQKQFDARPEIAALVPTLMQTSSVVTKNVFAHGEPTQGQLERTVNQFLANASINNWPVNATLQIWDGIVQAGDPTCASDPNRWLKNPAILRAGALGAALLQYIPLHVLLDMAVMNAIGEQLLRNLILLWADHPELVADIVPISGLPWQSIYTEGKWALPPYGGVFSGVIPLLSRDHIQPIVQSVKVPVPQYPDFTIQAVPVPQPQAPSIPPPVIQPPTLPPAQGPQPPPQPPNVVIVYPNNPPPPTQEQKDYACYVARLLRGNSQLTQSELAWYNNPNNVFLLNDQIQNPQCQVPIVRPVTPPQGQVPSEWTTDQLDIACYISRLLYANSPLTTDERAWLDDPHNTAILNAQLNNPQCKTPLLRQQPGDVPVPQAPNCPQPQPIPVPGGPQGPTTPIPPQQGPPDDQPCPPMCQHQIDVLKQRQQECCDEVEQSLLPRVVDLEHWVWDIERRVPGMPPILPQPYPIPPSHNVPGTDIPFPPPDEPVPPVPPVELPPITDCDSPFVLSLWECIKQKLPTVEKAKKLVLDACDFGTKAWGWMAECWLSANTPQQTVPVDLPMRLQSLEEISKSFDDYLAGSQDSFYQPAIEYGTALIDYGLRLRLDLPAWPTLPDEGDIDYVFVDRTTSPTIEVPIVEEAIP